jgi:hypothetical protein
MRATYIIREISKMPVRLPRHIWEKNDAPTPRYPDTLMHGIRNSSSCLEWLDVYLRNCTIGKFIDTLSITVGEFPITAKTPVTASPG